MSPAQTILGWHAQMSSCPVGGGDTIVHVVILLRCFPFPFFVTLLGDITRACTRS